MSEDSSRYKRRRRDFFFGLILVTIILPLLDMVERSLGLNARWLSGANGVVVIFIFIAICQRLYHRKECK
jgi:hypothetical protein